MANFTSRWSQYTPPSTLKELDLAQSTALVDLLLLTVMVDEKVTDDELKRLAKELEKLPFENEADIQHKIGAHAAQTRDAIEALLAEGGSVDGFIEAAASKLTEAEHRREAMKIIAVVSYADGIASDEEKLFHKVGKAFGYGPDEIERFLMVGSIDEIKNPS
jgi:hypothetical protein